MITFQIPNQAVFVLLKNNPEELLKSFRQIKLIDKEAGGVLIGERRGEGFIIFLATPPQNNDIRFRNRFNRKISGHQSIVDVSWQESDGIHDYIGEWHTHPEDIPTPSLIDRIGWAMRSCSFGKPLVVLIEGRISTYVAIQNGLKLNELVKIV